MPERQPYLVAYDIADPRRLRLALRAIKGYATGGQKSVFECYFTPAEYRALLRESATWIDRREDAFLLLRLDPRTTVITLGIAEAMDDPLFFYCG